jgi:hypothetical protein
MLTETDFVQATRAAGWAVTEKYVMYVGLRKSILKKAMPFC